MTRRPALIAATGGALLLAGGAAWAAARFGPELSPGLGFAAKLVCSEVFVAGRTEHDARGDMPDHPLVRVLDTTVDSAGRRVVAAVPVFSREAVYRDGYGCTILPRGVAAPAPVAPPAPRAEVPTAAFWPEGERVDSAAAPAWVDRARLAAALDGAFAEPDPAANRRTRAVVVVHGGRIIAERYAAGFTAATPLLGWSMAKGVTAALAGILVGEGRLALDQRGLAPEWRNAGDARADVTLDQLLRMSSGLDFVEEYGADSDVGQMLFAAASAGAYAADRPLRDAPGTRWYYSSGTSNIVARLLRETIGDDAAYHTFPRRALFDRIGMRSAVLEPDASGTFVGSSYMYATARDWARFGLLFLDDGVWAGARVLPKGWVAYSTTPTPAADGRYAAHWWLDRAGAPAGTAPARHGERHAFSAQGHDGQSIVIIPERDLVIVRLGLSQTPGAWDRNEFVRAVLAAVAAPPTIDRRQCASFSDC